MAIRVPSRTKQKRYGHVRAPVVTPEPEPEPEPTTTRFYYMGGLTDNTGGSGTGDQIGAFKYTIEDDGVVKNWVTAESVPNLFNFSQSFTVAQGTRFFVGACISGQSDEANTKVIVKEYDFTTGSVLATKEFILESGGVRMRMAPDSNISAFMESGIIYVACSTLTAVTGATERGSMYAFDFDNNSLLWFYRSSSTTENFAGISSRNATTIWCYTWNSVSGTAHDRFNRVSYVAKATGPASGVTEVGTIAQVIYSNEPDQRYGYTKVFGVFNNPTSYSPVDTSTNARFNLTTGASTTTSSVNMVAYKMRAVEESESGDYTEKTFMYLDGASFSDSFVRRITKTNSAGTITSDEYLSGSNSTFNPAFNTLYWGNSDPISLDAQAVASTKVYAASPMMVFLASDGVTRKLLIARSAAVFVEPLPENFDVFEAYDFDSWVNDTTATLDIGSLILVVEE